MGLQLRKQSLPLNEDLEQNACRFSFEMAAYILEHGSDISFGKDIAVNQAPFKTVSINSFYLRGTEIEKIKNIDGWRTIFIERLAITGLNAPLPTPYGELILRRTREQDTAMASFINVFNSRLLGISYQISKRRYLNLQNHKDKNCMFVRTVAAFCGEDFEKMNRRFSRVSHLLWMKEKSASGLGALITALFGFHTKIGQFQTMWTDICENNRLDKNNLKLGINSGLGRKASVSNFGIKMELTHPNFDKIYELLEDTAGESSESELRQMKYIVRKYAGDFCSCRVAVMPQNAPLLRLGTAEKRSLGRTTWIPRTSQEQGFDAAMMKL